MNQCWNCRFWSELVARTIGGGPVEAICEHSHSPHAGEYTTESDGCDRWQQDMSQYEPPVVFPPVGV